MLGRCSVFSVCSGALQALRVCSRGGSGQEMDPCVLLAGSKGEVRLRRGVKGRVVLHSSVFVKDREIIGRH